MALGRVLAGPAFEMRLRAAATCQVLVKPAAKSRFRN
jgi:hypothetical protein